MARDGAGHDTLGALELLPAELRVVLRGCIIERRDFSDLADEHRLPETLVRERFARGVRLLRSLTVRSS